MEESINQKVKKELDSVPKRMESGPELPTDVAIGGLRQRKGTVVFDHKRNGCMDDSNDKNWLLLIIIFVSSVLRLAMLLLPPHYCFVWMESSKREPEGWPEMRRCVVI